MAISAQTWIIQMLLFGDLKASQYIDEYNFFLPKLLKVLVSSMEDYF
jgi:hypothetical protein